MSEKQKPMAYYKCVVFNSLKNEYRQNDNAAKYIVPVGEELFESDQSVEFDSLLELSIPDRIPKDWLMFIENQRLFMALQKLNRQGLMLVFLKFQKGYTQAELAEFYHLSQQAVSKRQQAIIKKIKNLL